MAMGAYFQFSWSIDPRCYEQKRANCKGVVLNFSKRTGIGMEAALFRFKPSSDDLPGGFVVED